MAPCYAMSATGLVYRATGTVKLPADLAHRATRGLGPCLRVREHIPHITFPISKAHGLAYHGTSPRNFPISVPPVAVIFPPSEPIQPAKGERKPSLVERTGRVWGLQFLSFDFAKRGVTGTKGGWQTAQSMTSLACYAMSGTGIAAGVVSVRAR
eukprot:3249166-Rhodomonas_salina.3